MIKLNERIQTIVEKHCSQLDAADKVILASFLTAECFSIINEYIHEYQKTQFYNMRKSNVRRQGGENGHDRCE